MNAVLRVSVSVLTRNAERLRRLVVPAQTSFVVKSNAYGHGLAAVGRALEPLADRLCVYSLEEAIALREAGITLPILVMGPVEHRDLRRAAVSDVEIALWDTRAYLRDVIRTARERETRCAVHVKVNTGVTRLGLDTRDAPNAIASYAQAPELSLRGVFSHLACAEELDVQFTRLQCDRFEEVRKRAAPSMRAGSAKPLHHIAASAAAMLWPWSRFDMVRFGIALYGLWPSAQTRAAIGGTIEIEPALSFHSTLVAVRHVEADTPIGYGGSFRTSGPMRVGIVPLGYADGIPRALSNRGAFIVANARCPIVGRVCMNMTIIDLENAPSARPGDGVTLIGTCGGASVTADDWAGWADTIPYEIVARLPAHIPRVYEPAAASASSNVIVRS